MTKKTRISAATVLESIVPATTLPVVQEQAQEPTPETGTELAPTDRAPQEEPSQEPEAPTNTKVLFVDSPIKKALFDQVLRAQLMPGGRWGGKAMARLASEWVDIEVKVAGEGQALGRTFEAQKGNWNFNDSNYTNQSTVYPILAKIAREANGGQEVPKKVLIGHLEDLKLTCQKVAA